jgi:hypothetical protein
MSIAYLLVGRLAGSQFEVVDLLGSNPPVEL